MIKALVSDMMGIQADDAQQKRIKTFPHLIKNTKWVEFTDIPVFQNKISVMHKKKKTIFTNFEGEDIPLIVQFTL